ncbi:MAG: hypothetical protein HQ500_09910 [Flavobacteriales bacterium]|nr:hypothetical protein [Flavobacteriales bacterium]
MRTLQFIILYFTLFAFSTKGVGQEDEVYLLNGEYFKGEIVAIGTNVLLIKSEDRVFSVDRSRVKYVFREKTTTQSYSSASNSYTPVQRKPEVFSPLDRVYLIEVGGGLYTFSNFALSMHLIHWFKLNDAWSIGALGSLDLSKYVMLRFGVRAKRSWQISEQSKSYFVGGVAVGPWADYFIDLGNAWQVDGDFSAVFQTNLGGGLWYDTGSKLAIVGEGGLSLNHFTLRETVSDWQGARINDNVFTNIGPYFRVSIVF